MNIQVKRSFTNQYRLFTEEDVETAREIHRLIKVEKYTLKGALIRLQDGQTHKHEIDALLSI